jgi:hypothetical protein
MVKKTTKRLVYIEIIRNFAQIKKSINRYAHFLKYLKYEEVFDEISYRPFI